MEKEKINKLFIKLLLKTALLFLPAFCFMLILVFSSEPEVWIFSLILVFPMLLCAIVYFIAEIKQKIWLFIVWFCLLAVNISLYLFFNVLFIAQALTGTAFLIFICVTAFFAYFTLDFADILSRLRKKAEEKIAAKAETAAEEIQENTDEAPEAPPETHADETPEIPADENPPETLPETPVHKKPTKTRKKLNLTLVLLLSPAMAFGIFSIIFLPLYAAEQHRQMTNYIVYEDLVAELSRMLFDVIFWVLLFFITLLILCMVNVLFYVLTKNFPRKGLRRGGIALSASLGAIGITFWFGLIVYLLKFFTAYIQTMRSSGIYYASFYTVSMLCLTLFTTVTALFIHQLHKQKPTIQ
ncbi:MAG: hypothetical protein FWH03_02250 [Firmicutes bacterium]|nr:hypothetical protein [Bacillota bacterium]